MKSRNHHIGSAFDDCLEAEELLTEAKHDRANVRTQPSLSPFDCLL
jgi:hypothetical protein